MRASLIRRSEATRAVRSAARVRRRAGIISPRFSLGARMVVGNTNSPVDAAKTGKKTLPAGVVV
jgi:hypothetical protein